MDQRKKIKSAWTFFSCVIYNKHQFIPIKPTFKKEQYKKYLTNNILYCVFTLNYNK